MYEFLCGQPPFEGDNEDELYNHILEDPVKYPKSLSSTAVSLLEQLLVKNPSERYMHYSTV